jgi:hypothetical protein
MEMPTDPCQVCSHPEQAHRHEGVGQCAATVYVTMGSVVVYSYPCTCPFHVPSTEATSPRLVASSR